MITFIVNEQTLAPLCSAFTELMVILSPTQNLFKVKHTFFVNKPVEVAARE